MIPLPPGEWLFDRQFDAGWIAIDRGSAVSGVSPAQLLELARMEVVRSRTVEGRTELDLHDLLLARLIMVALPHDYCAPADDFPPILG